MKEYLDDSYFKKPKSFLALHDPDALDCRISNGEEKKMVREIIEFINKDESLKKKLNKKFRKEKIDYELL